jgi:hypothetical protein
MLTHAAAASRVLICEIDADIPQRVSPLSAAILCLFTLDLRLLPQQLLALQFCCILADIPQRVSPLSAAILCLFTLDLMLLLFIQDRASKTFINNVALHV